MRAIASLGLGIVETTVGGLEQSHDVAAGNLRVTPADRNRGNTPFGIARVLDGSASKRIHDTLGRGLVGGR